MPRRHLAYHERVSNELRYWRCHWGITLLTGTEVGGMRRRSFLAVAGTGLLAGCSGDGDGGSTPTATDTATPTDTPTATPTPEPPTIQYMDCSTVDVSGESYSAVALTVDGESTTHEEGYSGRETFEADGVIHEVVVWSPGGKASLENPTLEECTAPDPYDPEVARENAREPSYDEFFRNFEEYQGDPIRFEWGAIYQTIYEDGYDYYQMTVSQSEESGTEGDIAATWYGETRYLEEDLLNPVIGVAEELYTYETVQGNERTIPQIEMVAAELDEE